MAQTLPPGVPPHRPLWTQIAALAGSFVAAILLGSLVGQLLQPQGEATTALVTFALLLVFIGGMALWGAMAASIMARALFNGDFALALLRFFLRGRLRGDVPRFTLDRERIVAAAVRAMGWSRVFVWLALAVAVGILALRGRKERRSAGSTRGFAARYGRWRWRHLALSLEVQELPGGTCAPMEVRTQSRNHVGSPSRVHCVCAM